MHAQKVTKQDMDKALAEVNKLYDNNVIFNRFEPKGSGFAFTLRVKSSKNAGHSLGFCTTSKGNHRRITAACWHVHGNFFEKLLEINPDAKIVSCHSRIDKNGGNWQDFNKGSMMNPFYASEACDCQ